MSFVCGPTNNNAARSTPLHEAARFNNVKSALKLVVKGDSLNARNERGNTPLHEAVEV